LLSLVAKTDVLHSILTVMAMSYIHTRRQKYHILIVTETEHLDATSRSNFERFLIRMNDTIGEDISIMFQS
jgi:hypothetical protein